MFEQVNLEIGQTIFINQRRYDIRDTIGINIGDDDESQNCFSLTCHGSQEQYYAHLTQASEKQQAWLMQAVSSDIKKDDVAVMQKRFNDVSFVGNFAGIATVHTYEMMRQKVSSATYQNLG